MFIDTRCWNLVSFTAPARRARTRKSKRQHAELARVVEDDVWRALLMHCNHARSLVLLSGVNRALRALIHDNHALMRYLFQQHWSWNVDAHRSLNPHRTPDALLAPMGGRDAWRPRGEWKEEGVPGEERTPFNRYVWRLTVQTYAPWCSVCHVTVENGAANVWAMGVRVCPVCLPECFVSHRVLWREYGVWVGSGLSKRRVLMDEMQRAAYSVLDTSPPVARALLTTSVHDLRCPQSGGRRATAMTYLFWKAHLPRVLRLDKALAVRAVSEHASQVLCAFAARWVVQRVFRMGPLKNATERLRRREIAHRMAVPGEFMGRIESHFTYSALEGLRMNPLWLAAAHRAWERVAEDGEAPF